VLAAGGVDAILQRLHEALGVVDGGEQEVDLVDVEHPPLEDRPRRRVEGALQAVAVEQGEDRLVVVGVAVVEGQQQRPLRQRPCRVGGAAMTSSMRTTW
jgi:hypothetical protein